MSNKIIYISLLFLTIITSCSDTNYKDRLISAYEVKGPSNQHVARVYSLESGMAFGSVNSRLAIAKPDSPFEPDLWKDISCDAIGGSPSILRWEKPDTLEVLCLTTQGDRPKHKRPQKIEVVKQGDLNIRLLHYRITASGLNPYTFDSLHVSSDSITFFGMRKAYEKDKLQSFALSFRPELVSILDSSGVLIEARALRLDTTGMIGPNIPMISSDTYEFTSSEPVPINVFKNVRIRRTINLK